MNIDAKILNKIFTNWIQEYTKTIIHLRDAGMVQYMKIHQRNPLYKQTQRKKNHMVISLGAEKAFDKM